MPDALSPSDVPCSGCGRAYPAERLSHGRTFHCACGDRVGRRAETGMLARAGEPRFLADVMLGKLARWLRALGYDAAWEPEIEDEDLVRRGIEEERVILTRDRGLASDWWVDAIVLIESDDPLRQLREVADAVNLSRRAPFTRCTHCNQPLEPASPEEVRDRVPAGVLDHQERFTTCPACRRVYWSGGHVERMRKAIEEVLDG